MLNYDNERKSVEFIEQMGFSNDDSIPMITKSLNYNGYVTAGGKPYNTQNTYRLKVKYDLNVGMSSDSMECANEMLCHLYDKFVTNTYKDHKNIIDSCSTYVQLASYFNDRNISTRRGGKWYSTSVKRFLERCRRLEII